MIFINIQFIDIFIDVYLYRYKQFGIGYILIDLSSIFPIQSQEFKISISVKTHDEKTAENYRKGYVAEKRIVSKLWKISILDFNSKNWRHK